MRKKKEIILGIDGSTTKTGIAIYDKNHNVILKYDVLDAVTNTDQEKFKDNKKLTLTAKKREMNRIKQENMEKRVDYIIKGVHWVINEYKPTKIVMEDIYAKKDMNAYKWLARIQGYIYTYQILNKIEVIFVTPSMWRKWHGIKTTKNKVRLKRDDLKKEDIKYVKIKLKDIVKTDKKLTDDGADAICLATYKEYRG